MVFTNKQKELQNLSIAEKGMQKVENLRRIGDFHDNLCKAIDFLDIKKVKTILEDCGTDLAMVLNRTIHLQNRREYIFLLYPLHIGRIKRYNGDGKKLKQEDLRNIKEITKFLWGKASHDVRDSWLKFHQDQQEKSEKHAKQPHLDKISPVIKLLKGEQQFHAKKGDEGWLEDFIQEVKNYEREKLKIKSNKGVANNISWKKIIFVGVCTTRAVVAYLLACPVVALILAIVMLVGIGTAQTSKKTSVEKFADTTVIDANSYR